MSQLGPGNTLLLADGSYGSSTSGPLQILCGTNAVNGASDAPITVAALHERQALISVGTGDIAIEVIGCAYWNLQGLAAQSGDDGGSLPSHVFLLENDDNLDVSRSLLSFDGTDQSGDTSAVLEVVQSNNILLSENEVYNFGMLGVQLSSSRHVTARRNYLNGRSSSTSTYGFYLLNAGQSIFENNVVEGAAYSGFFEEPVMTGLTVLDSGVSNDDAYLGNIDLNALHGFSIQSNCAGITNPTATDCVTTGSVLSNNLFVGPSSRVGFVLYMVQQVLLLNNTATRAAEGFALHPFDATSVLTAIDNAAVDVTTGFVDSSDAGFFLYCDTFGGTTDFSPSNLQNATDSSAPLDPAGTGCVSYLPANSALVDAGVDGGAIGANIVYEYDGGTLTDIPLWNDAGQFPCGAVLAGINDSDAGNCLDVNLRINGPRCPLP